MLAVTRGLKTVLELTQIRAVIGVSVHTLFTLQAPDSNTARMSLPVDGSWF